MNFKELGENLGLEEDEYKELVELFLETGSADFETLRGAVDSGDVDQIVRSAHTLNGAAGNLGLLDVHKVAKQIELDAGDNKLDGLPVALAKLQTQFETINTFVNG